MDLSDLRRDFGRNPEQQTSWPDNPFLLFKIWIGEGIGAAISEANAMVLSTSGDDGRPSSRIVLLKEYNETVGFIFYTNYTSRKGKELAENPYASLHFFWREMERQIMIEGIVEKTTSERSTAYFNSRPIDSRVSAIVSPQSKVIDSLDKVQKWREELLANPDKIRRPSCWGGYHLVPDRFEFWQGGQYRLHHRMAYYSEDRGWTKKKLAP